MVCVGSCVRCVQNKRERREEREREREREEKREEWSA